MSSGEKILDSIKSDCDKTVEAINAECRKICDEIIAEGEKNAEKAAAEVARKSEKKAARMKDMSKSGAELAKRSALLGKRRNEIDITFDLIGDYLKKIDRGEYFDLICKLASKLGGRSGKVMFNAGDLAAMPDDLMQKFADLGVEARLSDTPADIDGGFILVDGGVEENMSFSALLSEKREEIEDLINSELFAR